jgi:hypothetical protein
MTPNIGSADRIVRIIVGILLLLIIVFVSGPARWWGLIGLVPLGTALVRYCPMYSIFGIRTNRD